MTFTLELAVQDVAGARVARQVGADSVELCAALGSTGGLTPSPAMVQGCVEAGVATHVLIRPRPGPFVYDADEVAVMVRDVSWAVALGATGVVIGALTSQHGVDLAVTSRLLAAAGPAIVTFHRAIDVAIAAGQAEAAVDQLVALGLGRVLTSGGQARSLDGRPALAALARQVDRRLAIIAGGGVRPADIAALAATGVAGVHLSARAAATPAGLTGPGGGPAAIETTSRQIAAEAAAAVAAVASRPAGPAAGTSS